VTGSIQNIERVGFYRLFAPNLRCVLQTSIRKGSALNDFVMVKRTQMSSFVKTPLYILNNETGYVLYKPVNKRFDIDKHSEDQHPNLYINTKDRKNATNELQAELKKQLVQKIHQGEIRDVKHALCEIVHEVFSGPIEESIESLPATIDIVYEGFAKTGEVLKDFVDFDFAGYPLASHSVNVMAFSLSYCLHNNLSEGETKRISLCALLHDIGLTKLPQGIVSFRDRLPDSKFREYQTHTSIGHDIVKQHQSIDSSLAIGILEHHECIDGSGYPRGIANVSFEGRVIGLINSFDHLTNSEKNHRRKRTPFDAMMLIKDEVLEKGRFDKSIYKDLCLILGKNVA
jgi:HD-GYP domain-containing protein (c-di-GMP phosphodiesterase class II)